MANTIFDIPITGWNDSLYGNHVMVHDMSQPEATSTNLIPVNGLFSGSISPDYRQAYDASSGVAIDWESRTLVDSWGNIVLNWANRYLLNAAGNVVLRWDECKLLPSYSGIESLDWRYRYLSDSIGYQSINWENRWLRNISNSIVLDWQSQIMSDSAGNQSLDWSNRLSFNSSGQRSIDWDNQVLASNWLTNQISVDWYNRCLYDVNYNKIIDWQNGVANVYYDQSPSVVWVDRFLSDGSYISLKWDSRVMYDSVQRPSIDWQNRQLLKVDGTLALDWSTDNIKICRTTSLKISQSGTSDPVISSSLISELVTNSTMVRTAIGTYFLVVPDGSLDLTNLMVYATPTSGTINCTIVGNQIVIKTYNLSGVLSDNLLSNTPLKLEYYN